MINVLEDVKELEQSVFECFSKDEYVSQCLMIENAANNLLDAIKQKEKKQNKKFNNILILCGSGNNASDGYALCRKILFDYKINILKVAEPKTQFCIDFYNSLTPYIKTKNNKNGIINEFNLEDKISSKLKEVIENSDCIIDCIFGTGFKGVMPEKIQKLFKLVNHTDSYKIACDIPSGLDKTGENLTSFSMQQKSIMYFLLIEL